jgi:predicted aldo/keto reductase-like oxidoreductase
MRYRKFGNTGLDISALGFGAMRLPCLKDGSVDEREAVRMLHYAMENGVNYLDTAYLYHDGASELAVSKALKGGWRDKTYIATKSPLWLVEKPDDFDRFLTEQLGKLNTDHIDFYLIHNIRKEYWQSRVIEFGLFEKALTAKAAGKINHIGFSFHDDFDTFKTVTDYYPWDFCQIQLNYLDVAYQAGLGGLRYAAKKGLGVVVMEPLKGGNLAAVPPSVLDVFNKAEFKRSPVEWALDYLWNMPEVSFILSGMSSFSQTEENIAYAERAYPGCLNEAEKAVISAAQREFKKITAIACTSCNYCLPCPNKIAIPYSFTAFNDYHMGNTERAKFYYNDIVPRFGKTGADCTACLECEKLCPQGLKISALLRQVDKLLRA